MDFFIWPRHLILRLLTVDRRCSCRPMFGLIIFLVDYIMDVLVGDMVHTNNNELL